MYAHLQSPWSIGRKCATQIVDPLTGIEFANKGSQEDYIGNKCILGYYSFIINYAWNNINYNNYLLRMKLIFFDVASSVLTPKLSNPNII